MNENNRRIAKNTIVLYVRTFITMLIGLYTSRVLLEALGINNYGIQNVIGGIVGFTSIVTASMGGASSRYITFALGEGDSNKLLKVFSTTANVQIILGIVAVVFLEVAGVWFLNTTANIPEGRMTAANWVLQCAIITTFISIACVPYSSTVIAHEHMGVFAWIGVGESIAKLGICYLLMAFNGDRLIFYSWLLVGVSILSTSVYLLYCYSHFPESHYKPVLDKPLFKEMAKFSGWSMLNNSSWVMCTQGVNMLINVFFGVAFNAARGVAGTVNGCVQGFVGNFGTAFRPQITKSYAAGDLHNSFILVNRSTRITWLLMYIFIVPICLEADTLLHIWLTEVPPMAALFLQFALFESLAVQCGQSYLALIQANGNLKRYTIEAAIYAGLIFPFTWIAYALKAPVWACYPIFIFIFLTLNAVRINNLHRLMNFPWRPFWTDMLKPCLAVSIISLPIPLLVTHLMHPGLLRFFVVVPVSVINVAICIYFLGLDNSEKKYLRAKLHI